MSVLLAECPDQEFGLNCTGHCHCKDGLVCDKTTGQCPSGCAAGYSGDDCSQSKDRIVAINYVTVGLCCNCVGISLCMVSRNHEIHTRKRHHFLGSVSRQQIWWELCQTVPLSVWRAVWRHNRWMHQRLRVWMARQRLPDTWETDDSTTVVHLLLCALTWRTVHVRSAFDLIDICFKSCEVVLNLEMLPP